MREFRKAFTLVELSVVILVLSFFVAATLGGAKIKQIALANGLIAEQLYYRKAIADFQKIYGALPGDFAEADYTLSDVSVRGASLTTLTKSQIELNVAINGDGNGKIMDTVSIYNYLNGPAAGGFYNEILMLWKHLYKAKILAKNYTGIADNSSEFLIPDYNIPKAKNFDNVGWAIFNTASYYTIHNLLFGMLGNPTSGIIKNKHIILLAGYRQNHGYCGYNGAISPSLAQMIDLKLDDGNPIEGLVMGLNGVNYGTNPFTYEKCNNNTYYNAGYMTGIKYETSTSGNSCVMFFVIDEF